MPGRPPLCLALSALLALLAIAAARPATDWAGDRRVDSQVRRLLRPRGQHSVSIRLLPGGEEIYALNAAAPRRLASVSKLFTVATALARLGPDYRFRTGFYADGLVGPSAGNLYLKGFGDPFLVSEEWRIVVGALPLMEVRGDVVVDDSYFEPDLALVEEPGVPNPYNAINAAFATNFNTLHVVVEDGHVRGEEQTPLTPFTVFDLRSTRRGPLSIETQQTERELWVKIRGRLGARPRSLRFNLGRDPRTPALYAGHLFAAFFARGGGTPIAGTVRRGSVPESADLLYLHRSSLTLAEVASELLDYSNNFIANQVFLVLGAEVSGAPANVQKSRVLLAGDVKERVGSDAVRLFDGSGLDPRNVGAAAAITTYLTVIHDEQPLLHTLLRSYLDGRVRAKSGTYTQEGVRAMAGYLIDAGGEPYASFALLCDGRKCDRRTPEKYDQLLAQLSDLVPPPIATSAPATGPAVEPAESLLPLEPPMPPAAPYDGGYCVPPEDAGGAG
ncbi:MAG: D-alanyl-D-alanine carboxypeptidase [Deltaproteobacteria bacterium]|nr:D-alanyl-D-alanine carboxypeptidase [Deltaproteobacteria bacterium]